MTLNFRSFAAGSLALATMALTLTGCGVNTSTPAANASVDSLSGIMHGGPNPVVGATVNLYATTSGGYGAAPTLLGTAVTDSSGSFTFTSPATCTAGQQAYITGYGGNPGSGANPNYIVMAALGPCANISSSTVIWLDELTTVAAAYTLRPFITITGSSSAPVVQIGAPANNNAATGTCTTVASITTGCVAAGLTHAFANALNIANSVSIGGVAPKGTAYTVTPSNTSGSVPAALINSLADAMEACVNSNGGAAGDSSICGNLFSYTTPPVSGGVAPTNTLQAMMNVAQYPALTAANVTNLYNLATPVGYYAPALSAAPTDFSMAIAYSGPSVANVLGSFTVTSNNASGFGSGTGYTVVPNVTLTGGSPTTAGTATASLGLTYFNVTGGTCATGTNAVTITGGGGSGAAATATYSSTNTIVSAAVTASGSGYTSVPTFTVTNCTTQPSGPQKLKGIGVVSIAVTNPGAGYQSAPTVTIDPPTATGSGIPPVLVQAVATSSIAAQSTPATYSMSLDANDNVYNSWQNAAGNTGYFVFTTALSSNGSSIFTTPNSTTNTTPRGSGTDTLGHYWLANNSSGGLIQGFNTVDGSAYASFTATNPFGLAIDKSNNVWYGTTATTTQNLYELQQATTYSAATFATPPIFSSAVRNIAFDPNQNVYVSGFNATTNTAGAFPNAGTATVPVYGLSTNPAINVTLTGASGPAIALDASNNVWSPTTAGLVEIVPTFTGTTVSALTPGVAAVDNSASPSYDAVDGSGNIWITNSQTSSPTIVQFVQATGVATSYSPCYAPGGATICAVAFSQPQRTQVDSTGSVWVTSVTNGKVYQLLGTGSPAWPQLSLGAPGVMPQ